MNVFRELLQTTVLLMCFSFPASAEISKVYMSENPKVVVFQAPIDDAAYFALTALYKKTKFEQINITSFGGDFDIGMQIAKFVYENDLKVYVPSYCASACTFAFFTARPEYRDLGKNAKLGLHNISFETSALKPKETYVSITETMEFAREVAVRTGMMMALYSTNGVPGDVLLEVANKHGAGIVNVTRNDLIAWGSIQK